MVALLFIFIASCKKEINDPSVAEDNLASRANKNGNAFGTISGEMVLRWNKAAIEVVTKTQQAIPDAPVPQR